MMSLRRLKLDQDNVYSAVYSHWIKISLINQTRSVPTLTQRAYNFNAGPSALPQEVLEKAQQQLVDFRDSGMSIMEMSHRSAIFDEVHNEAIALLKKLYAIPENYEVLFLQGG